MVMSSFASDSSWETERTEWPTLTSGPTASGASLGSVPDRPWVPWPEEHEVEIAERRHLAAARPAEANQRELFGRKCTVRAIPHDVPGQPDDLVLKEAGRLRRCTAITGSAAPPAISARPRRAPVKNAGSSG
jgi:hypothetical protein